MDKVKYQPYSYDPWNDINSVFYYPTKTKQKIEKQKQLFPSTAPRHVTSHYLSKLFAVVKPNYINHTHTHPQTFTFSAFDRSSRIRSAVQQQRGFGKNGKGQTERGRSRTRVKRTGRNAEAAQARRRKSD